MQDRILFVTLLGFAVGVAWGTALSPSLFIAGLCVVIGVGVLGLTSTFAAERRLGALFFSLLCFAAALGIARASWSAPVDVGALDAFLGQKIAIEGVVVDEPDRRETTTRLTVNPERVNGVLVSHSERVLISYARYPDVVYGDRIVATGTLMLPEDFETDTGRVFPYTQYLHKDGIRYTQSFAEVAVVGQGEGSLVLSILFGIKHAYLESIGQSIVEPEASLLGGITVGAKESLGSDITDVFRNVGIIHIVVLSGYNISIVADSIMRVTTYGGVLPRSISLLFGAGGVVMFALMTGASATVVRASIMALLVVLARASGRVYDIVKALLIAGFFMIMHSPYILVFDPSFQLSFMATLGLVILGPLIEQRLQFVPTTLGFREFTTATLATQVFVLPLLLFQSGQLSLIALVANLLVLIAVPYAMLFGFLAGFFGLVHGVLAFPFALIAYVLLAYILTVAEVLSYVPFASVSVPPVPFWLIGLMYASLAFALYRMRQ